ncbi:ArdC-like ssDNA-binding domain-containing protein [Peptococcus simiae]|uniref:ArdC-like ssDNA-binding domain-containing protein n=1 Tax=Peptococcus simiae TaxID=1643805 RepID=UPI0039817BF8
MTKQNEKVTALLEQLELGLDNLFESDNYRKWLETLSHFHAYSFGNTVLIASQCPEATRVAGYQTWKKLNRQVRKGEKAIKILAPVIRKVDEIKKDKNGNPILNKKGEPVQEERLVGYRTVSVFDISQTDGEELPGLASYRMDCKVQGYDRLFEALKAVSPVPVRFQDLPRGTYGYFSRKDKEIVLSQGMTEADIISTLFHEMAHSVLHGTEAAADMDTHIKEVEAESVAYVLSSRFGLPCEEVSLSYIAGWASMDQEKRKVLKKAMSRITKASSQLLKGIEEALGEIEEICA